MDKMPQAWFEGLGIKIYNLPRVFVSIAGFDIYWYAVIICFGMVMGIVYVCREAKRTGQNPDLYIDFFYISFIMALIGARLYYVIFNFDLYRDNLISVFNTRNGGLAIYGGVIGGVLAAFIFAKRRKLSFWLLADTAAPALILGQAIGRWANFFNREAFGGFTESIFALRYMASEVNYIPQSLLSHMVTVNGIDYIQVQPMFLYESFFNFLIFIILNILKKRKVFEGEIVLGYLTGYGIVRFFIEGMRTDQLMLFGTGLPVSQVFSVILIIFGSAAFGYMYKTRRIKI